VVELEFAKRVAAQMGVRKHVIVDIDLRQFGLSPDDDIDVPKGAWRKLCPRHSDHLCARGIRFSCRLRWLGRDAGAQDIFIGVNALDYSGYPDCRPNHCRL